MEQHWNSKRPGRDSACSDSGLPSPPDTRYKLALGLQLYTAPLPSSPFRVKWEEAGNLPASLRVGSFAKQAEPSSGAAALLSWHWLHPTPGQPGWLSLCPCLGQPQHSRFGAKNPAQL